LRAKIAVITVVGCLALWFGGSAALRAQNKNKADAISSSADGAKLSEQEMRGQGLFLQRCSLCHLPRKLKFGSPPVVGPSLSGQFKDANADQMKTLRGFILKGGPDMPGFQYGLDSSQLDDLIAYLKTL
jgi:mono/diheme cytochrome c family protein